MEENKEAQLMQIPEEVDYASSETSASWKSFGCSPPNVLVYVRKKYVKKPPIHAKLIYTTGSMLPKEGSKEIVVSKRAKLIVVKVKENEKSTPVCHDEGQGKESASKVELDTMGEWEISMGSLRESERWEERESLHERLKSFLSSMRPIQGEVNFHKWKGSVLDSIMGAYLTQNVSDTFSSSAFISLAAKYPTAATGVHFPLAKTVEIPPRSCRLKVEKHDVIQPVALKTRKRQRSENGLDALKKYYSECDFGDNSYDNETSDALDWKAVQAAGVDDIAEVIKKRGMSNNLAARIKNCLNMLVHDFGCTNLEWIKGVPDNMTREYLLKIPGLGLKSVECIRLLSLFQKAFPIDTNAGRVAVRLGWVPIQPLPQGQEFHHLKEYPKPDSVQRYLWPLLSKLDVSTLYELHCQMITFGKVFCTKRSPNCNACPMKAECKHYTSAQTSARLSFLGEHEKNDELADTVESLPIECVLPKGPDTDELKLQEPLEWDIEDFGIHKVSKALMILNTKTAVSLPVSKSKNVVYLRTEHRVYELPDSHHMLAKLEKREANDLCPYLLATWPRENLDKEECDSKADTVYGTLLLPTRTAMRGNFPLNGTYFQANEVFADDESCEFPIKVSVASISNLLRTTLYCGNNVSTICKGMKIQEVRKCFAEGYLCFRRFNRKTRETKALSARFYFPEKPSKGR